MAAFASDEFAFTFRGIRHLLTRLSGLATNEFALVTNTFALIGFRRTNLTDLRRGLAH